MMRKAVNKAPATMAKLSNGQPLKRERKAFQAYTVSQLMESYRDPRAILLEIAGYPIIKLMKVAGCTVMEAIAEKRLCAQAVLPYVAQKLPVQVDMRHTRAIHLNIVDERQYKELIDISTASDQAIEAHVIEGIAHESAQEDGDHDPEAGASVRPGA